MSNAKAEERLLRQLEGVESLEGCLELFDACFALARMNFRNLIQGTQMVVFGFQFLNGLIDHVNLNGTRNRSLSEWSRIHCVRHR